MADTKITGFSELTAFDGDEMIPIVDDPGGTPANRKTRATHFLPSGGMPFFANTDTYLTPFGMSAPSNLALAANRLYMVPIFISRRRAVTTLAINLGTLQGTSAIRLGLYNANPTTGQPLTLIQEATSGAQIDSSTGTGALGTKTAAVSQTLNPGWYYLSAHTDGTPSVHGSNSAASAGCALGTNMAGGSVVTQYGLFRAKAYGAMGDETGNTFTGNSSGTVMPFIGIR
jgi:hypothetical protein